MVEVAVVATLLVVIVGFMVWDRRSTKLSRSEFDQQGFLPGISLTWQVPFLASGLSACVAVAELWAVVSGNAPLWTSTRPSWQWLHGLFGPSVNLVFLSGLALGLWWLGFARLRRAKADRRASRPHGRVDG